jgi:adenylyltransferase/sulfurtransferase
LGVGGLGCGVAMGLARLGVRKLIMIDRDVVDESNLNRQILFTREDIGKPKAETGKMRVEMGHKAREDM